MTINLDSIFYEDYLGVKWETRPGEIRQLTWSIKDYGEWDTDLTALQIAKIKKAFGIWDYAIEGIDFAELDYNDRSADITISSFSVDGPGLNFAYWGCDYDENMHINYATIVFDSSDFDGNKLNNEYFLLTAMHEIGNILGLGDLVPSDEYRSVQEDPFPEQFTGETLWDFDERMIDALYPMADKRSEVVNTNPSLIIEKPATFKKKTAVKVIDFNPSTDTMEIDTESFGINSSTTFDAGKNKKTVKKKLAKQDFDFLYDQKKGGLYFNENGSDRGFGNGGIVAILKGAPDLTLGNLDFI